MKQYFTGFFTAVCLTVSVFLFLAATKPELGDIKAKSITIVNEDGTKTVEIRPQMIALYNGEGVLGTRFIAHDAGGHILVKYRNGKTMMHIDGQAGRMKFIGGDGTDKVVIGTFHGGSPKALPVKEIDRFNGTGYISINKDNRISTYIDWRGVN